MIRSCGESDYLTLPSISERFSGCGGCAVTNAESIEEMDSGDDSCDFEEPSITIRIDSEDQLAGGIIAGVSIVALIWYCFVLVNIFFVLKKLPIFVIFFSQGIGDIGFLLNNIWLAVDIIVGPSSLMKDSKIYSIAMNVFARPVLFHFLFIAIVRFFSARFHSTFKKFFTKKMVIIVCCLIWIAVGVEIGVTHIVWPVGTFVNHNISLYGFYSQDICSYLASNYVIYQNAVNVTVGVLTLLCYLGCVCEFRKSNIRKSREGKLLAYCIVDFLIVFTLYALKAILFSPIRNSGSKIVWLFVQIVYTCTFVISAILLPVFSFDLWSNLIPKKLRKTSNVNVPSRVGARLTKIPSGLAPTRRFSTLESPVLTVEGL